MKILVPFEKLFTPYVLIAFYLAIILATEFIGGGTYFADTGLVHAIAVIFVGLIIIRIFSDYAFSDHILKGFLKIQLAFLLLLGLVHVYEYLGLIVFPFNHAVVELSAMASYFLWLVGVLLALEFVFHIYYKKSIVFMVILGAVLLGGFTVLIGANISTALADAIPVWFPDVMLLGVVLLGVASVLSTRKIIEVMPVFKEYSRYAIPAIILLVLATFSEYFESTGSLQAFGVSETQNLYISHFLIYAVLSLLLIAFGKLKKPTGIYAEM